MSTSPEIRRSLRIRLGVSALGGALLLACAGHSAKTQEARNALDAGNPKQALAFYNEALGVASEKDPIPDASGDRALFVLDRSMILQSIEDYASSSRDLELADKQVELLDFSHSTTDDIGRYIFSDDVGPYRSPPYEKVMVNTMNMVNYLARHDLNGARIEARRLAIVQKYLRDNESVATPMIAPGSYLAGFVFEKSGRDSEALRYYEEALEFGDFPSLRDPVRNLVARSGGTVSARTQEFLDRVPASKGPNTEPTSDILVVLHYGRVPAKEAKRVPIGLALTYGSLYLTGGQVAEANRLAAQGLVTWVNYPELEERSLSIATPSAKIDGRYVTLEAALAVDVETRKAYDAEKGAVIASAITRMIARAVAGNAAGAAVNDSLLSALISIGTQAALTAADTPDTRSWSTLPARIAVARIPVAAGAHEVTVAAQGSLKTIRVDVRPGNFETVVLTVLR